MPGKIYFYLLLLCGIWSQGIIRIFADEIKASSDFLVREKRVVSYVPGEDKATGIFEIPYVVMIKHNWRLKCVGSILSYHVVITIAQCVQLTLSNYDVVSGASRADHGISHSIINVFQNFGVHPSRPADGIALLTVDPSFVFGRNTNFIELHSGPLLRGTLGLIAGWGSNFRCADRGTSIPRNLRTIGVSVMAHRDCVNSYRPHIEITEKDVCTYHPQRHCGHTDGGAPLIVDGHLAGIHLWTGLDGAQNDPRYPDVFAMLQHSEYNQWIRTNIRDIEAQFENRHK